MRGDRNYEGRIWICYTVFVSGWGERCVKFSREEVDREIGKIVDKFSILECDKCARALLTWLDEYGFEGILL